MIISIISWSYREQW